MTILLSTESYRELERERVKLAAFTFFLSFPFASAREKRFFHPPASLPPFLWHRATCRPAREEMATAVVAEGRETSEFLKTKKERRSMMADHQSVAFVPFCLFFFSLSLFRPSLWPRFLCAGSTRGPLASQESKEKKKKMITKNFSFQSVLVSMFFSFLSPSQHVDPPLDPSHKKKTK